MRARTFFVGLRLRFGPVVSLCIVVLSAGCAGSPTLPADAVARYAGGYVTAAEVERQVAANAPRLESGQDPREWVTRRIVWRRLLAERWREEAESSRRFQLNLQGAERSFVGGLLMADLEASVEVPESEVEAVLQRQRERAAGRQESLRVRHIFLRADSTMSAAERAAQRDLAEQLLDRARSGEDFLQLAREFSQSETARTGGLIGGLRRGSIDRDFERAAFALEKGQISDVVTTSRGFHIILLEDRFTPQPLVDEEVRPRILDQMRSQAVRQRRAELVTQLEDASTYTAGWTEDGQLQPDERGVVLEVGDVVVTVDDLDHLGVQPAGFGRSSGAAARLTEVLESELLYQEGLERGLATPEAVAEERARVAAKLLPEMAEQRELEQLQAEITREDLARFMAESPQRVTVPGDVRAQVLVLGFEPGNGYDVYVRALGLVERARHGEDFEEMVRQHSVGPKAEQGGDSGLVPLDRLSTFGPDVTHAISLLEVGGYTDPIRLPKHRVGPLGEGYDGAFVIVKLVERAEDRLLDLDTEGDEIRRRYWQSHGAALVEQRVAEVLNEGGFELLEQR